MCPPPTHKSLATGLLQYQTIDVAVIVVIAQLP